MRCRMDTTKVLGNLCKCLIEAADLACYCGYSPFSNAEEFCQKPPGRTYSCLDLTASKKASKYPTMRTAPFELYLVLIINIINNTIKRQMFF